MPLEPLLCFTSNRIGREPALGLANRIEEGVVSVLHKMPTDRDLVGGADNDRQPRLTAS